MSIINSVSNDILIALIYASARHPSDTKSKDIITDICKNLKYDRKNVAIFKLIFENKVFYPLPQNVFVLSCRNGLIELVECLLKNMANVDISRSFNYTSVIYETLSNGHTNIAKLLIKNKIFAKKSTGELTINGLETACEKGFIETVKLLLEAGVKPSNLCIYMAAQNGHYEIVKILLDYPEVDPNCNSSAILTASKNNFDDIVKLILQKRPNITPANFKSDDNINKKIISIYNQLYPVPVVEIPVVEIPVSSNNNGSLNDLLKQLRQEMAKQNIFKITITSDSILVTNDLKI